MHQLRVTANTQLTDPATKKTLLPVTLSVDLPDDQVLGFLEFFACLATKTDVLIPAIVAIVACVTSAAPPAKQP